MKLFHLLLASSLLTGCGYRWQSDYPHAHRPTVTIPFVTGDDDGRLTAEITRALSASGLVDVVFSGGYYRLQVAIVSCSNANIGYRQDSQKVDGEIKSNLLAIEGRKSMMIEASLYHRDELVCGPYLIASDADYDYVDGDSIQDLTFTTPTGSTLTVLPFSLGQLEPIDSAQEAAQTSLYSRLAQKVVDAISVEW